MSELLGLSPASARLAAEPVPATAAKVNPNKRVCAVLFDLLLVSALGWVYTVLSHGHGGTAPFETLAFAFLCFRDSFGGRSPGKRLVGLVVVDGDGNPIAWLRSLQRNAILFWGRLAGAVVTAQGLAYIVGFAALALVVTEYALASYSASGLRLGDRFAGSRLVDDHPERSGSMYALLSVVIFIAIAALAVLQKKA